MLSNLWTVAEEEVGGHFQYQEVVEVVGGHFQYQEVVEVVGGHFLYQEVVGNHFQNKGVVEVVVDQAHSRQGVAVLHSTEEEVEQL